jgi:hypothetical protein
MSTRRVILALIPLFVALISFVFWHTERIRLLFFPQRAGSHLIDTALTHHLISYWELEESSGTRHDSHGTNHLTDNNTVTSARGKVGIAAQFARASSQSLTIDDNASLSVGDIDYTVAAWAYMTSTPTAHTKVAGKGTGSGSLVWGLQWRAGGHFRFEACQATGLACANVVADSFGTTSLGTWYFIVAWHDATANTLNIQVNNGNVDSLSYLSGGYDDTGPFNIGGDSAFGEFWDGLIDQVGFWKRVLTSSERTQLYNNGNGMSYSQIKAERPNNR